MHPHILAEFAVSAAAIIGTAIAGGSSDSAESLDPSAETIAAISTQYDAAYSITPLQSKEGHYIYT